MSAHPRVTHEDGVPVIYEWNCERCATQPSWTIADRLRPEFVGTEAVGFCPGCGEHAWAVSCVAMEGSHG